MAKYLSHLFIAFILAIAFFGIGCNDTMIEPAETLPPEPPPFSHILGPYDTMIPPSKTSFAEPSAYAFLLGRYTGVCRDYRVDFNQGQFTTVKDTFVGSVDVFQVGNLAHHHGNFGVQVFATSGTGTSVFPNEFYCSPEDLGVDTILLPAYGSGSPRTHITIIPQLNSLDLNYYWLGPSGPDSYELWCKCYKVN